MDHYVYKGPEELSVASVENSPTAQSLAAELASPAQHGERHSQIKRTIIPMVELGLCDTAIFAQYRGMYDVDFPDSEIVALIEWGRTKVHKASQSKGYRPPPKKPEYTAAQKLKNTSAWLKGSRIDPADLWEKSQIRAEQGSEAIVYLSLFQPADFVNLNARYIMRKLKDGAEKAELCGPGETKIASEWVKYIQENGIPEGRAGVWVRINPLQGIRGNSPSGAHTDADVLRYARVLLESDILPYDLALSLFAKVHLPICAIVDSAGRGPHAIGVVDARNAVEYALKAGAILKSLEPFGIDQGNANPSRYSRLPGAKRIIGARPNTSIQNLLYLAPQPETGGIFA
jgi:hypothetical protein